MAVLLTGSGGLFTRLGHLGGLLNYLNATRGGATTSEVSNDVSTKVGTIEADYANGTARRDLVDGIYGQVTSWKGNQSGLLSQLQTIAKNTVIAMVNDDTPQPDSSLATALTTLISQMTTAVASVNASSVAAGAQAAVGTPNGNPQIVVATKDQKGKVLEYTFAETLTFTCTQDSQGSATAFQEPLSVKGAAAQTDTLNQAWPAGSAVATSLNAIDATQNNQGGFNNLLQNSDFVTYTTTDNPDNWTIAVGAATTNVANGTATPYTTGGGGVRLVGDGGGTLAAITQQFNTMPSTTVGGGGTSAKLTPLTEYAVNFWIRCSATPAAGVLEVSLVDGSGTTIQDANSVNNLFTKSLTAVSTSYINVNDTFRTPALMPSTVKFKIRLSTAIDNGKWVEVGRLGFAQMRQIYQGGPYVSVFSGNTKLLLNDAWTVAMTNTFGAFQKLFQRFFAMTGLGLILPSSGSPTINDNLIA